jgi:DNA-binding response OmpR family regulator
MNPLPVDFSDVQKRSFERALLVDDDRSVRDSLAEVLSGEGYHVCPAANGEEAIRILETDRIDVVLLDLTMPRLNGWNTFEKITERWPLIPILIITARPNQLFLAASAGAAALLEKPVDIPVMISTIRAVLDEPTSARLARLAGRRADFVFASGQNDFRK